MKGLLMKVKMEELTQIRQVRNGMYMVYLA